ncbi:MAG: Jag N-terminal domain-containing protein [Chloroflexi bacterium]|nr:Jag N-terminal domain-containing protein [Chloroflexota bacterium]
MSEYQEFTGRTVEEAIRAARETLGVSGLEDLDFEILTPGSRGVLGMGAEPARIIAAARSSLGGATPRREAAASEPLPVPPPRPPRDDRGPREDRGPRDDRGPREDRRPRSDGPRPDRAPAADASPSAYPDEPPTPMGANVSVPLRAPRPDRPPRDDRRGREGGRSRGDRPRDDRRGTGLSQREAAEVASARASLATEREEIQAAEASPEALAAGKEIVEQLVGLMGYRATVSVGDGDTAKIDVAGADDTEREALGALIGRKGERLSALQHLVNLMLSRRMGAWTRVLVDVEDYRGRRERQLGEIARRAAERVIDSGTMLQLEPMPALERRWIHLALRDVAGVSTQSIGDEPMRRVVILHVAD